MKMALRDRKETLALQDFVVQQNIMMHTRKREMKEFQAHLGPKEPVVHRVPAVPLEFLEALDHPGLASKEPLEHQASKEEKGSKDPQGRTQSGLRDPPAVLVPQAI